MTHRIDRLEALGVLPAVDAALGRLLAKKSPRDGDAIGLAGALASAALAHGHSCLPLAALHGFAADLAAATGADLAEALPTVADIRAALRASSLAAADATRAAALVFDTDERIYLRRYFVYEQTVAQALRERLTDASLGADLARIDASTLHDALAQGIAAGRSDDVDQRIAVLLALRSRLLIVSGGPGSGKTTTVLRLLALIVAQARTAAAVVPRIALAAPTGKAAARLAQTLRVRGGEHADAAIPATATTLHRLLGLGAPGGRARFDRNNPLPYDLVVIDEASMLDLALAARLCEALAPSTRLILLGDRDQLAAVEAGRVFGALSHAATAAGGYSSALAHWLQNILLEKVEIASQPAPLAEAFVELRGNHRFGAHGAIGRLARALRDGEADTALGILGEAQAEAALHPLGTTGLAQRIVRELVSRYADLAQAADADAAFAIADRFRVLCALREGAFGAVAINAAIEHELRRRCGVAETWYPGRLVIVGGNDYRLGLFNGDVGVALARAADGALEVWFRDADGSLRALPPAILGDCAPAYALTVHKAQGSEFDEVVVVLPARDARVLTRELAYTAVTRARSKVELWTSAEILAAAAARSTQRWSGLADRLA